MSAFYNRLEELAAEIDETPQTLAKRLGVSNPSVTGWKNGSDCKSSNIVRIAKFFGVSTDYLLGVSDCRDINHVPLGVVLSKDERDMLSKFRMLDHDSQMRELGRLDALSELPTK